jgi:hypothetical protein
MISSRLGRARHLLPATSRTMATAPRPVNYASTDANFETAKKETLASGAPVSNRTINYMALGGARYCLFLFLFFWINFAYTIAGLCGEV